MQRDLPVRFPLYGGAGMGPALRFVDPGQLKSLALKAVAAVVGLPGDASVKTFWVLRDSMEIDLELCGPGAGRRGNAHWTNRGNNLMEVVRIVEAYCHYRGVVLQRERRPIIPMLDAGNLVAWAACAGRAEPGAEEVRDVVSGCLERDLVLCRQWRDGELHASYLWDAGESEL